MKFLSRESAMKIYLLAQHASNNSTTILGAFVDEEMARFSARNFLGRLPISLITTELSENKITTEDKTKSEILK